MPTFLHYQQFLCNPLHLLHVVMERIKSSGGTVKSTYETRNKKRVRIQVLTLLLTLNTQCLYHTCQYNTFILLFTDDYIIYCLRMLCFESVMLCGGSRVIT